MERILVGIDDETASQVAVDWVIRRVQGAPAEVRLFTAFDELFSDPLADAKRLDDTADRIREAAPGTTVTTELGDRSILEGLVERSADADLLVIGSHPHRRVRSILTGAFPSGVAVRSHCPTVVVPDDWQPGGGPVVLAVADDDSSARATVFAAEEAVRAGVPLDAVHAWQMPTPMMESVAVLVSDPDELEHAHQDLLEGVVAGIRAEHPGLEVRPRLFHGPSGAVIEDAVGGARLLVLGTHRRDPALGALLGSHVQRLLHRGRVPIAVVGNDSTGTED